METLEKLGLKNPTSVGLGEDFFLKNMLKGCFYLIFLGRLQADNDGWLILFQDLYNDLVSRPLVVSLRDVSAENAVVGSAEMSLVPLLHAHNEARNDVVWIGWGIDLCGKHCHASKDFTFFQKTIACIIS